MDSKARCENAKKELISPVDDGLKIHDDTV